jgi:hypothetical protein
VRHPGAKVAPECDQRPQRQQPEQPSAPGVCRASGRHVPTRHVPTRLVPTRNVPRLCARRRIVSRCGLPAPHLRRCAWRAWHGGRGGHGGRRRAGCGARRRGARRGRSGGLCGCRWWGARCGLGHLGARRAARSRGATGHAASIGATRPFAEGTAGAERAHGPLIRRSAVAHLASRRRLVEGSAGMDALGQICRGRRGGAAQT